MYLLKGRVRYSECDATGRLSLVSIVNYLQDCSTFQSEEKGLGLTRLAGLGVAWVLDSWRIEVGERPALGEEIVVSTWCYEMSRAHALRCFEVTGADGRSLVRADSRWVVLDVAAGHVTRVPQDQLAYVEDTPRLGMGPLARRLVAADDGAGELAPSTRVVSQELDTNRHVNNAQYVRLALQALEDLGHAAPEGLLQVRYRRMARLGDLVCPHVSACEGGWDVNLADEEGATYALVRLTNR